MKKWNGMKFFPLFSAFLAFLAFPAIAFGAQFTLTVAAQGDGYVSSSPSGILCGAACSESYDSGRSITLTATSNEGASFVSWGGDCSGSSSTCTFTLDSDKSVTAKFSGQTSTEYALTAYKAGTGNGTISSEPFGVGVGMIAPYDSAKYAAGTRVTLTAAPASGSVFAGWTGDCAEKEGVACVVEMDAEKSATSRFNPSGVTFHDLKVSLEGPTGSGKVTSTDGGIDCGDRCTDSFEQGKAVKLTAVPSTGFEFAGWSGACTGAALACSVSMSEAKNATASFKAKPASATPPSPTPGPTPAPQPGTPPENQAFDRPYYLTLQSTPASAGTVSSSDAKIDCGTACLAPYEAGSRVTLKARASPGFSFKEWTGCSPKVSNREECTAIIESDKIVTAVFAAPETPFKVTVAKEGTGSGGVTSSDYRVYCGRNCTASYYSGSEVTLNAFPDEGSTLESWSGACNGSEASCTFNVTGNQTVTANFKGPPAKYGLRIEAFLSSAGTEFAGGRVASSDKLIDCTATRDGRNSGGCRVVNNVIDCRKAEPGCGSTYVEGTTVTLTATPVGDRAIFKGWSGSCIGTQPTCTVKLDSSTTVGAEFSPIPVYLLSVKKTGGPGSVKSDQFTGKYAYSGYVDCGDSGCLKQAGEVQWNHSVFPDPGRSKGCAAYACGAWADGGSKVELTAAPSSENQFIEWVGACTGTAPKCVVSLDSNKSVTARFSAVNRKKITVEKPALGEIRAEGFLNKYECDATGCRNTPEDGKIQCGSTCTAEYDAGSVVKLYYVPPTDGLAIAASWVGCDAVTSGRCIVPVDGDKTVKLADLPDQVKKYAVSTALGEFFTEAIKDKEVLASVLSHARNPSGKPFTRTFQEFQAGKTGKSVAGVKEWIGANQAWFYGEGGVQAVIDSTQKLTAKKALLEVFAPEMATVFGVVDLLYDDSRKPLQLALADLKAEKNGGGYAGLVSWIRQNRQAYLDNTGISELVRQQQEREKASEEAKKAAEEARKAKPSISSISPEGRKIGNPAVIRGAGLLTTARVEINGQFVESKVVSDNEVKLPAVKWGFDDWGVKNGVHGNVALTLSNGEKTQAKLISPSEPVIYNGDGKTEECFGGVGPGCKGITGKEAKDSPFGSQGLISKSGCTTVIDGRYRNCWTNMGSIRHDNCCVRYPGGKWCGGPGTDGQPAAESNHNGKCDSEWHDAVWDVATGKTYGFTYDYVNHEPDLTPSGTSLNGRYDLGEAFYTTRLCVDAGAELRQKEDAGFCCSGNIREESGWFWSKVIKCT